MLNNPTDNIKILTTGLSVIFTGRNQSREKALKCCREVICDSCLPIRAVRRPEFDNAREMPAEARHTVGELQAEETTLNELFHNSIIRDSEKEYTEAAFTLAIATSQKNSEPESQSVYPAAYFNGLGEAAGELRRYPFDNIRRDNITRAEELLEAMEEIHTTW